jgi:hydrogenase nickel incorporation protein HypA/HybF
VHELALTQDLVETVLEHTAGARVRRVVLAVGQVSMVVPESLQFCFEICTRDTAMSQARLEIVRVPGRARCCACDAELALEVPYGQCGCGSTDLTWLSGHELTLREVEVE